MNTQKISRQLIAIGLIVAVVDFGANAAETLKLPEVAPPLGVTSGEKLGTNDDGIGLVPGAKVQNFVVSSHEGKPVEWDSLVKQGPLLVVFYRGGWCPYCNVQIRQLTLNYPEFKKRGVLPVLISVDETDGATLAQKTYEIPFPVLSDPNLKAHTAFNVIMEVDADTAKRYKDNGLDLEAWSGRDHHKIAISSAFLVDKTGVVRWANTSKDYRTRPSPEQLMEAADSIDW